MLGPWKLTTVDNDATQRGSMSGQILGQRVNDDVGASLDRLNQSRRRHCIVDDQRHAMRMRHGSDSFNIDDVASGVANRLAKDSGGLVVDQALNRNGRIVRRESNVDALFRQHVLEQRV